MNTAELRNQIKRHEGCVLHAYQDHLGFWTIGYGRLIDERRGGGISQAEAEQLLSNDITRVIGSLEQKAPSLHTLPEPVQHALVNMAYQMGVDGLMQFTRMWQALDQGDFARAADEALDSRWAEQTPGRAKEVAGMIRNG
jgi:lysozyme